MRILVAFGSKRGGTAELAQAVGESLAGCGHQVDVLAAQTVDGIDDWDAVVVGGALYAGRWQRRARRFVQRHTDELSQKPVWFFSSGPLDDSARAGGLAPTASVNGLMRRVHARGHATFGGRLTADARGLIAHALAKSGRAGDWRDFAQVKAWALGVGHALSTASAGTPLRIGHRRARRVVRRALGALCLFTGVTATVGGAALVRWPLGPPWVPGFDVALLAFSPFSDFLWPGVLLGGVVGLGNLCATALLWRRHPWREALGLLAGGALTGWIVTEMVMLREVSWLQPAYLGIGLTTLVAAAWLWAQRWRIRANPEPAPR